MRLRVRLGRYSLSAEDWRMTNLTSAALVDRMPVAGPSSRTETGRAADVGARAGAANQQRAGVSRRNDRRRRCSRPRDSFSARDVKKEPSSPRWMQAMSRIDG